MNPSYKVPENNNGFYFYKMLIILSFIMLSSLTWSSAPLQKAIEGVTTKYEKQAKAQVCLEVIAHKEVYHDYSRKMFISGCLTSTRHYIKALAGKDKKRLEEIEEVFNSQDSLEFDRYSTFCQSMAAEYERQGNITEKIISSLWYDFKCDQVDKEAFKEN